MKQGIGIDLGGTNVKAALIDGADGKVLAMLSRPTFDGEFVGDVPRFAVTVREMVGELEAMAGQGDLGVGLSAPGVANPHGHCIDWMPGRMCGLEKFDWPGFMQRDVRVLNDAQSALLGEIWIGAAKGCSDAFLLTLGTGVGGAVVSGGRLLRGAIGRAGHLGHITVDAMGAKDACNTPGSLEDAVGNWTIQERGGGRYANTLALVAAVQAGDAQANEVWTISLKKLAAAIASLINVLDPEVVIIGGGIASGAGASLFGPLQAMIDDFEWRPGGHRVRLALAEAGEWAGTVGAVYQLLPKLRTEN